MSPTPNPGRWRWLAIGLLLAITPALAFVLIASALTADAGPARWLLTVVAPLAVLGTGLYAMTGDAPDWLVRPGERA